MLTKNQIIKKLQAADWIGGHWRVKDFIILETPEKIIFSYYHGDMGLIDKIIYHKKNNFTEIFELDNYYGDTKKVFDLYL